MNKTVVLLLLLAVLTAVFAVTGLRGCIADFRKSAREAGKAEVAVKTQEATLNATVKQAERNNQAAIRWRDLEEVIANEFEPFYASLQPGPSCPSQAPAVQPALPCAAPCSLDAALPADLERDLRLRVAKTNDGICARGHRAASAACAAWAEARAAFLGRTGLTWRRLALYVGQCLEVIALNDNDKIAVILSLGEE
ncbi:hypothetical protein LJC15_00235 [Desulfovibrio sp. OttesenSCG-928-G11]|nr:hypothetical protein [Desulfovibrio sp. OttesenSCG-928-G11]